MSLEELKTEARKLGYRLIPLDWKRKELKGETKVVVEKPVATPAPRKDDLREPILIKLRDARVRKDWKLCIELEKELAALH